MNLENNKRCQAPLGLIKETGKLYGDESHVIHVNSKIKDESALGKLMHVFSCTDVKGMRYKIKTLDENYSWY